MSFRVTYLLAAAAGLLMLVVCSAIVRDGSVSSAERRIFHDINQLPEWLYPAMWLMQQAGNLGVALCLALAVALALRRWRLALVIPVIGICKLMSERVVKMFVERQRPATSTGDAILRGSVPAHGFSFVSGHMVLAVALATALAPVLNVRWKTALWILVALIGFSRIYVGAHNPLDIVGGAGLGLFIGAMANVALGPHMTRAEQG